MLAVCVLAACQQVDAPGVGAPMAAPRLALVPAPGGLLVEGSGGREIGFGRDRSGALASIAKVEGGAARPVACGAGREAFATAGGLGVVFEGGTFVGWRDVTAAAGRGCG